MAISKEQIFETANRLEADGHAATLAAIRKAIGGGSYTTISEAMKERKATPAPATAIKEAAPETIASRLADVGAELWAAALAMANDRLAKEREEMEARRAELEASRGEAADLADHLAAELDAEKQRSPEAATQAEGQIAALRSQLDEAKDAEARAMSKTQADAAQIEQMAARIEDARAVAKREADAHAKASLAAQASHDETRRTLASAEAQAATARAEMAALSKAQESDKASMTAQLAEMRSRVDSAEREAMAERKRAAEAREDVARLAGQLEALNSKPARSNGSSRKTSISARESSAPPVAAGAAS